MRVKHDFISRNHIELTVRRGETVEVNICLFFSTPRLYDTEMLTQNNFFSRLHLVSVCPQLLDKSKQWWRVRNSSGEEGYVPNNVLEAADEQPNMVGTAHTKTEADQQKLKSRELKQKANKHKVKINVLFS